MTGFHYQRQYNHLGALSDEYILTGSQAEQVKASWDGLTFDRFTAADAWELGHLLYARLLPLSATSPTVISIALANTEQILFQAAVGSGTQVDNASWVQRKRRAVLRWGCSTWYLHCRMGGDEALFYSKFSMSPEQASSYSIHGGGVPIRVEGVEGVVAVVVVSGLSQDKDHGVIFDVVKSNWQ